jgi:hypothetical protein
MRALPTAGPAFLPPAPLQPAHAVADTFCMRGRAYQPLIAYLAGQSAPACTLTFAQIEAVLGWRLPVTAHAPGWWRDRHQSHVRALAAAGWRADATQVWRDRITFARIGVPA